VAKRVSLLLCALLAAGCAHAQSKPPAPDFTLTSDRGMPWTLSSQHGRELALFFGYTHCTDTCPDTLAKLTAAMHASASARGEVVFVTIDPDRDTPSVMHSYIRRFSGARIVGLTGTPAQIDAVENE
jgi:protein SCO1/2